MGPKGRKFFGGGTEGREGQRPALDRVGDAASNKVPYGGRAFLSSINDEDVTSPVEVAGRLGGVTSLAHSDEAESRASDKPLVSCERLLFARNGGSDRHYRI